MERICSTREHLQVYEERKKEEKEEEEEGDAGKRMQSDEKEKCIAVEGLLETYHADSTVPLHRSRVSPTRGSTVLRFSAESSPSRPHLSTHDF